MTEHSLAKTDHGIITTDDDTATVDDRTLKSNSFQHVEYERIIVDRVKFRLICNIDLQYMFNRNRLYCVTLVLSSGGSVVKTKNIN